MTPFDADVLVVGAGIAGLAAAYYASRAGRDVTLVDDGRHRASDLPVALVNPVRGREGRVAARGIEGMHATFALVDALRAEGHAIAAGRGLYRPLVGSTGEQAEEPYWRARFGDGLAFDWFAHAPASLGLVDAPPTLRLRDAGWVAAPPLLHALAAATRATRIDGRVVTLADDRAGLADGVALRAKTVLWCAGAWGAAGLDGPCDAPGADGRYKPGSLLASASRWSGEPMAFGLYATPFGDGTLVGPTREPAHARFPTEPVDAAAVRQLEDRVAAWAGVPIALAPAWRGVRLAQLSTRARATLGRVGRITALNSRGFLMAPLLAREWAASR